MSDDRPQPRYGEYAPGYVPGSDPAPSSDPTPPPGQSTPAAGQSTPPPVPPASPWVPATAAPVRPRRTGDIVATIILLGLGLIGMLVGVLFGVALNDPSILSAAFERQGYGSFHGTPGAGPAVIIVSHVVLYLLALGLSIRAMVRRRLAFWIPLVAGVVAAVFFWVSYVSVIASDPTFLQRLGG